MGKGEVTGRTQSIHPIICMVQLLGEKKGRKKEWRVEEKEGQEPCEDGCMGSLAQGCKTHNGPVLPVIPPPLSLPFIPCPYPFPCFLSTPRLLPFLSSHLSPHLLLPFISCLFSFSFSSHRISSSFLSHHSFPVLSIEWTVWLKIDIRYYYK